MSAALRLESFATSCAPQRLLTTSDLEEAERAGYARGLEHARLAGLEAICSQLRALSEGLTLTDDERARSRHETIVAVAPVLDAIIDMLGPICGGERLVAMLSRELEAVGKPKTSDTAVIRCPSGLGQEVKDCLSRLGLGNVVLDETGAGHTLEIRIERGCIVLDPEMAITRCRSIIQELTRED